MATGIAVLRRGVPSPGSRRAWRRYLREARRPWHCLLFLLPWVVIYESGAWAVTRGGGAGRELLAHSMIQGVLSWFGFVGVWVPGVALVVALLVWHRRRRDRWRTRGWVLAGMVVESLVLAVPLLVISGLFAPPPGEATAGIGAKLVAALGAGVYEELLFRLLLISALIWFLVEVIRVPTPAGPAVAVVLAAIVFSLCHFAPVGCEPFDWATFWFKLVAGLYLSAIYLGRGLGVASGSHAAYNLVLVWMHNGGG